MLQCDQCEHYAKDAAGKGVMRCDPASTIKEEACLAKWQVHHLRLSFLQQREALEQQAALLVEMRALRQAYDAMLAHHARMAPLQEKMARLVEREVEDLDEGDAWKRGDDDGDDDRPSWR